MEAFRVLMLAVILIGGGGSRAVWADGCPLPTSDIDTDRPDTTYSSAVVSVGSLQVENGINVADWSDGTRLDGTNSRVRLGMVDCAEVLVDLPDYSFSPRSADVRGFTGIAPAGKLELEGLLQGLQVSIVTGVGLPTGASSNSGQSYKPYLQVPWSQTSLETGVCTECSPKLGFLGRPATACLKRHFLFRETSANK
jgi:Putative MetA-pathway of phenol degradation